MKANTRTKAPITIALLGALGLCLPAPAKADSLNVVSVGAPAINCLFSSDCVISPEADRLETFGWFYSTGDGRVQSRVWHGQAGTPAAGLFAYLYRVDLSDMQSQGGPGCMAKLSVPAPGAVIPMDFNNDGEANDHVFVITQGALGDVGPETASTSQGKVWFDFGDTQISSGVCPGQRSFFFGFVSARPPVLATASAEFYWLEPVLQIPVHAPGALTFGLATQPVGPVQMISVSNLLTVANLPAAGGGFEVTLGESRGWLNTFSEMSIGPSEEYAVTMIGRGTIGSRNEAFTGSASLWVSNRTIFASADFSRAGVSALVMEYRSADGSLVAAVEWPGGVVPDDCGLPLCPPGTTTIPTVCSNAFVSLNGEPAACWSFCHDVCTLDPSCQSVQIHLPIKTVCVVGKNPALGTVQAITNLDVLLAGFISASSSSQSLRSSNGWYAAEGNVTLSATSRGVEVNKVNPGDEGGVTARSFPANVVELSLAQWLWAAMGAAPSPRAALHVTGTTSAGYQRLASLTFDGARGETLFSADFAPLGSTGYEAIVFRGTNEVGRYSRPGPFTAPEGPVRLAFARRGFTPLFPPNPCLILGWPAPVTFRVTEPGDLTGDTMMLVAQLPAVQVLHADAMTLLAGNVPGFTLTGSYALPAVQGRMDSLEFTDGRLRLRSDTLPGTRYILEVTRDLGASRPSWETLESFLGNGFSRSFSLPAVQVQGFVRLRVEQP